MLYENELFKIENIGANLSITPNKNLFDVSDIELGKIGLASTISSAIIFEITKVEGTNILMNENKVLVVGRKNSDNANIGWTPKPADENELAEMQKKISDNLKPVETVKPLPVKEEKPKEVQPEPSNSEAQPPEKKKEGIDYMVHHLKKIP